MELSLLREFVLSVPLAIVLPIFFGVEGALYSAPIADVGTLIAVAIMSSMTLKELNEKVSKEPAAEPMTACLREMQVS